MAEDTELGKKMLTDKWQCWVTSTKVILKLLRFDSKRPFVNITYKQTAKQKIELWSHYLQATVTCVTSTVLHPAYHGDDIILCLLLDWMWQEEEEGWGSRRRWPCHHCLPSWLSWHLKVKLSPTPPPFHPHLTISKWNLSAHYSRNPRQDGDGFKLEAAEDWSGRGTASDQCEVSGLINTWKCNETRRE